MATAVTSKPLPQTQKMKRPPPPSLQTSLNAAKPVQPSPSPATATKRLPGSGGATSATSQGTPTLNGTGARGNRHRKDGQRTAETAGRPSRLLTRSGAGDDQVSEKRCVKRYPEPYGK